MDMNKDMHEEDRNLTDLSQEDFLNLGLHQIAYIRRASDDANDSFTVHAADGTALSVQDSFAGAVWMARERNLYPVTIH